ncbi:MAG TPA: amidohydrolase family protein, partial [Kiritimatiellia bacterium]
MLIKNGRVWPSADADVIEDGNVLVRDGRIVKVGKFVARAEVTIDADGCLVMPGLIQGHIHLCQTIFRGGAEDLALLPWLRTFIWPLEAAHDEESIYASALLTCAELIRGGTTAFLSLETVRHTSSVMEAVDTSGLIGVIGHCLMDDTGGYDPL